MMISLLFHVQIMKENNFNKFMKSINRFILERLKLNKNTKISDPMMDIKEICREIYYFINETLSLGQLTKNEQHKLGYGDAGIIDMIIKEMIDEKLLNKNDVLNFSAKENIFIRVFMLYTANIFGSKENFEEVFKVIKDLDPDENHIAATNCPISIKHKNYCLILQ